MTTSHRLVVENLTVSYGGVPAIHHVDLDLRCGERVGLLGPNGAGKSTLLKAITGLVPAETGRVVFDAHGHGQSGRDRGIAYLPQRSVVDWDFPLTVRGLVELGRYPALGSWRPFGGEDHRIVDEALAATQLRELADRQISALSGGQQQRAFLARAWAQQAHVYLLDEPFTGLDRNAAGELAALLRRLGEEGRLVMVSHHDLKTVPEMFDTVVLLNGELIAVGPVAEAFTEEHLARAFGTQVFSGAARGAHHEAHEEHEGRKGKPNS